MARRYARRRSLGGIGDTLAKVPKPVWYGVGAVVLLTLFTKRQTIASAASAVVDDIRSVVDRVKWARTMYSTIGRVLPDVPFTGKLIIMAQAITESGWTGGRAAKEGFNYWNITAGPSWKGDVFVHVDGDRSYTKSDCVKQGKPMDKSDQYGTYCRIDQRWRKYPSLDAAVLDFWAFLGNKRYAGAQQALLDGSVQRYVDVLAAGNYFDPKVKGAYLKNVTSLVESVRKRVT